MEAIKKVYYYQKRKNLPIYGVQTPNLAKYTTSAKQENGRSKSVRAFKRPANQQPANEIQDF